MPWIWFIVTGSMCISGVYWIVSGQQSGPIEAILRWLSYSPVGSNHSFALTPLSLGLPVSVQVAISFLSAGLIGLTAAYLPTARTLAGLLLLLLGVRLLAWRLIDALYAADHPFTTVLSLILLAFEALSLLVMAAWVWRHHKLVNPISALQTLALDTAEHNQPVHILIHVDRQPLYRVQHSLINALNTASAHKWPTSTITLLDRDKRMDVAALCRKHDISYWSCAQMPFHKGFNTYLEMIAEPYVLIMEAGDIMPGTLIQHMLPPMLQDDTVSFVQAARMVCDPDVLQRNLQLGSVSNTQAAEKTWLTHVADAQAGWVPFLNTGTLINRALILQQAGGGLHADPQRDLITTSLRWQRGNRLTARYVPQIFVLAPEPDTFGEWLWARMHQQAQRYRCLIMALNPFGPTQAPALRGRLLAEGLQALNPWLRWGFFILPIISLFTGEAIIPASPAAVAIYYVPWFLALHFCTPVLTCQMQQRLLSELYHTADCLLPLSAVKPEQLDRFRKQTTLNWRWAITPLVLAALTIVGLFIGFFRQWYTPAEGVLGISVISSIWGLYNLILLGGCALLSREKCQNRLMPRFPSTLRAALTLADHTVAIGHIINLSESGLELCFDMPVPLVGIHELTILTHDQSVNLQVRAVHSVLNHNQQHFVGFNILQRPDHQRQQLIGLFSHCQPKPMVTTHISTIWSLLGTLAFWLPVQPEITNRRRAPRFPLTLSCVLEQNENYHVCFSQSISEQGMALLLKHGHQLDPQQPVTIRLQWADNQMTTLTATVLKIAPQLDNDLIRVYFDPITPELAQTLIYQLYKPSEHSIRVAPVALRTMATKITLLNGEQIRGLTQSVSEKGIVCSLKDLTKDLPTLQQNGIQEGQLLQCTLQWQELSAPCTYEMQVIALNPSTNQLLLYFNNLNGEQLHHVSQQLATTFNTPKAHIPKAFATV
jgi:hypothetical protein